MSASRTTGQPETEPPAASQTAGGPEPQGCQVGEVFDLLSKAHMLDVLHLLSREADGPLRFNEIQDRLDLSPRTLSERLKALTGAGLVERRAYKEIPPRVEYEITPKAQELSSIFGEIKSWTQRHDLEPGPDPEDG